MQSFTRDDGHALSVVEGFTRRVLGHRAGVSPRPDWGDAEYAAAARKRVRRHERLLAELRRQAGSLEQAQVLEVGCGDGLNVILLGLAGAGRAVGIDHNLRLFRKDKQGQRTRRLATEVLSRVGAYGPLEEVLKRLPVELTAMDATDMAFEDDRFDLLYTRSALTHLRPVRRALAQMARVVRPDGLLYHVIDPFFWLRGCHKRGLVDIPWAHASMTRAEYRRYVQATEGEQLAERRTQCLDSLNRLSLRQWQGLLERSFELVEWTESVSPLAQTMLEAHPEVLERLLDGVESRDLVSSRANAWLRNGA